MLLVFYRNMPLMCASILVSFLPANLRIPNDTEAEESGFAEISEQQDSGLPKGEWLCQREGWAEES